MADGVFLGQSGQYELIFDRILRPIDFEIDISNLKIGKEEEILLVSDISNSVDASLQIAIFFNNNKTSTNYWRQELRATGTTVAGTRVNNSASIFVSTSRKTVSYTTIKLTNNGYIVAQSSTNENIDTTTPLLRLNYLTTTFTATSITRITLRHITTDEYEFAGTRIRLYKVVR